MRFDQFLASVFLIVGFVAVVNDVDPAIGMGCALASLVIVRTRRER